MLQTVKRYAVFALPYASVRLKDDREFMLEAVKQDGLYALPSPRPRQTTARSCWRPSRRTGMLYISSRPR